MRFITLQLLQPGQDRILAGRLEGKRTFARLLEKMPAISVPTIVMLDFASVELATSSYLSEAVLALRDYLRLRRIPAYPVVANVGDNVREEFEELLHRSSDVLLVCDLSASGDISNFGLLGTLDPILQETLERVRKKGEAGAVELHAEASDGDGIGATAWNNRLSALAAKGLLLEIPMGRAKKYRPVLGGA